MVAYKSKIKSQKSKVLVCGGAGFIGSNFVRLLVAKKIKPVVFDKLTYAGNLENLPPETIFIKGDIADAEAIEVVFKKYKPDYLVNFAAETHVDRSVHGDTGVFVRTNVIGVHVLLESCRKFGIKKYVQVSTDEVYGDVEVNSSKTFTEESKLSPSSPYSSTKAAGDLLCMSYFRSFGLPVIVTCGSNTYGPYHYPEKIIPFFIKQLMSGKKVPVYGDGQNTRDWLHAEDHCSGILAVLEKGKPGEIYNISAENYLTNVALAQKIVKLMDKDEKNIEYVQDRPGHDRKYAPDSTKIRHELGWSPSVNFDEGLAKTIEWFKNNQAWLKNIKK